MAVVGAWLQRQLLLPWLAPMYGFRPGIFIGPWRDLNEPLSNTFAAVAICLFKLGATRRTLPTVGMSAQAASTRNRTLIFSALYAVSVFLIRMRTVLPRWVAIARRKVGMVSATR